MTFTLAGIQLFLQCFIQAQQRKRNTAAPCGVEAEFIIRTMLKIRSKL